MVSNFAFLQQEFPALANFGLLAEKYCHSDPNAALIKLGMLGETMVNLMLAYDRLTPAPTATAAERIALLQREGILDKNLVDALHSLRKSRNRAAHENYDSPKASQRLLALTFGLCVWFAQTYGTGTVTPPAFVLPPREEEKAPASPEQQQAETAREETLVEAAAQAAAQAAQQAPPLAERIARARANSRKRQLSEAETRALVDEQLRQVGWEADTDNLRHARGTRPQKGRALAIAEWPMRLPDGRTGRADYALFVGDKLYGIVEAKAAHKDISAELDNQGKLYARSLRPEDAAHALGSWGAYRVPFVFATNGRPWLEQFQTKSGIWFCDVRHSANIPRALQGWISPQGMKELFLKDEAAGNRALQAMPLDLLTDANGLNLREYQLRAITAAERAIIGGRKTALLAMATGTGKTRTVLGMIYRFLKTGRFRRVLFLVDRTALGQQAQDVFQDVKLEDLLPLADIYTIKSLDDTDIDPETRVQIATVQGMVKRVLYNNGEKMPAVTDYDLIIVDEAHRGYILDKGMSDSEYACRDQRDYQGKYRAVIDYFDAVKIALTATPALQTTEIFGEPVFAYTYREAVVDGYLVDHDAPHRIATVLNTGGIHYKPGETLVLYDPVTGEVTNSDKLDDELDFDVEHFNRQVVNDNFNRAVLHEIARHIDPEDPMTGKTLIYAVNDQHADTIVQILKEYYGNLGVNTDAIMKITGAVGGGNRNAVLEAIRHYKNEQFPSIAVTVDLLTTGLDVPEITTLVFMRCVRSRILFEQMLGRATRLCPRIRKQCFTIYDAVGVYETLLPVSTMKPVVANPGATLPQLLDELETLDDSACIRAHNEQILARLQRRRNNMDSGELEHFASMSGDRQPTQLLNEFKRLAHDPQTLKTTLLAHRELLEWLQGVTRPRTPVVIDDTPDVVTSHTRGFGEGNTRPEDYLHAFAAWLTANMDNVAALGIVCTRPRDLTRQALKELRLKLEREGFSAQRLNDAVNATSNTALTVDIITLIRRYALGATLVDHEQRIRHAVDRIRASYNLSAMARKWLERIEAYLMHESVLQTAVFDEDPRFRERGGFAGLDRIFEGQLQAIVNDINTHLYDDGGAAA